MRKACSIILSIVAGFFFYIVSLLGFVRVPSPGAKWGIIFGFSVPAVATLCGALALSRFRCWKRHVGVVLLAASGFSVFLVLTIACLLMTEEFRRMMRPDALTSFSDYLTGGAVISGLAGVGWILMRARDENPDTSVRRAR